MADRFDKFTERARRVLTYAQEEAQRFNHNYIGTEHLLLGLLREPESVAATVLAGLDVSLAKVRNAVEFIIGRGDHIVLGEIGFTPRAKRVIELTVDEARRLNHHYIGTEHLLLGSLREGEGIAAGVLKSLGVDLDRARAETVQVLSSGHTDSDPEVRQKTRLPPQPMVSTVSEPMQRSFQAGLALGLALSPAVRETLEAAWTSAEAAGGRQIKPEHVLLALIAPEAETATHLARQGVDLDRLRAATQAILREGLDG